ncbi:hypothetical protein EES46_23320 [Streptomyces sp. ADI98-10]|nr:hypothetical protein EES46_23320 [Streptomyces sp. ADI98-10]
MQHKPNVQAETRDLPPENGWARAEHTGQARTTCPCGLDTGLIPTAQACDTARSHAQQ